MENQIEKPDFVTQWHLGYLDDLRKSGITNMFGATPYLMDTFEGELTEQEAKKVLVYWMKTFSERHKEE